jgi:hypothetical protein
MKYTPLITLAVMLAPFSVHAGTPNPVPEPEVLPLLAIGIAAAFAIKFFSKKK